MAVLDSLGHLRTKLRTLEGQFQAQGGRGVDLAEEIDRLREKIEGLSPKRPRPGEAHLAGTTKDGRRVYRCLRWCGEIYRQYIFTLWVSAIHGEESGDTSKSFDARDVPVEFRDDGDPIDWVIRALEAGWDPETTETAP